MLLNVRCVLTVAASLLASSNAVAQASTEGWLPPSAAMQEHRIALVIGNGRYPEAPLRNALNDARDMAVTLRGAGFRVMLRENVGLRAMAEAVRTFGDSLREDSVATFYYAGHGVQVRDRNYLIPIGADIKREDEIPYAALDVNQVLDKLDRAKSRINIVILDACRNNPFTRTFRSTNQGLAQMEAPVGTLIAYATAPGRLAIDDDGIGRNGIYTRHLLANIRQRGLLVELMFKRVREGVMRESKNLQTPWESSSLRGDFAFFGDHSHSPTPDLAADPRKAFEAELALWESIKASTQHSDFESYLQRYPLGYFAELARARISQFGSPSPPPVAVAASVPASPAPAIEAQPSGASVANREPEIPADAIRAAAVPSPGDSWTYTHYDGFRRSVVGVLTYRIHWVNREGIGEFLSIPGRPSFDTEVVTKQPSFGTRRGLTFVPPDFSPYLQAFFDLKKGSTLPTVKRELPDGGVAEMKLRVTGEEKVTVHAGTFDTVVLTAEGYSNNGDRKESLITVWYAPAAKRFVKFSTRTGMLGRLDEYALFELADYKIKQ